MGKKSTVKSPPLEKLRELIRKNPLAVWRSEHSVTLSELSTLTGISISTLQRYENGANTISPDKIEIFRDIIGDGFDVFVEEYSDWVNEVEKLK